VGGSRSNDVHLDRGGRGIPASPRLTRRRFLDRLARGAVGTAALTVVGPPTAPATGWDRPLPAASFGSEVATAWFDLALDLVRRTPGFSPPVVSRTFGYLGVTLYEALVPGMAGYRSLARQLNDLHPAPAPTDPAHDWPTVANAALASILRALFANASIESRAAMDSLEASFTEQRHAVVGPGILRRSATRGRKVADHIFRWSLADGGHEAYLNNFPEYTAPVGPGSGVPPRPASFRLSSRTGDRIGRSRSRPAERAIPVRPCPTRRTSPRRSMAKRWSASTWSPT
jgi:hypothetical protein